MIQQYTGIPSDYVILGLLVIVVALLILSIINVVQMHKLKGRYHIFMTGKNARSLEDTLIRRLDQIDLLMEANGTNEREIKSINKKLRSTFCKMGLVKYDAFNEGGGKYSFALALLDEKDDGFVINVIHNTNAGCYIYAKDIIGGNSVTPISEKESEALEMALKSEYKKK